MIKITSIDETNPEVKYWLEKTDFHFFRKNDHGVIYILIEGEYKYLVFHSYRNIRIRIRLGDGFEEGAGSFFLESRDSNGEFQEILFMHYYNLGSFEIWWSGENSYTEEERNQVKLDIAKELLKK